MWICIGLLFKYIENHPEIELVAVYDKNQERSIDAARRENVISALNLEEITANEEVKLVLNLTNPRDHFEVSKKLLEAGKHVYSEKPFAMELDKCKELYDLAKEKNLLIASAPCSILGESAQTMKKAIDDGKIGTVRLVYAEMDDGPIYDMQPENLEKCFRTSLADKKDEYEVGCTLEHAGYCLNWLIGNRRGQVETVHAFADCLIEDKGVSPLSPPDTPDYSVANLKFKNGVVARITRSIIAPHNHEMRIIGDKGVLMVDESWHYGRQLNTKRPA